VQRQEQRTMSTPLPRYLANLVGVNFRPAEAREVVANLVPGDELSLERDSFNQYDENAIKVLWTELIPVDDLGGRSYANGETHFIGFIERSMAADIGQWIDKGWTFTVRVKSLTGDKRTPCLLELTRFDAPEGRMDYSMEERELD
jgi:hypothetical protein